MSLLGWVLWHINLPSLWQTLSSIPLAFLALSLALFFLAQLVSAYKWRILLPDCTLSVLLMYTFISQYYALLLPGQVAGEAIKAYRLGKGKKNAEKIAISVLFDRITGILSLLMLSMAGIYLSKIEPPANLVISIILCFCIIFLLSFSLCLNFIYRSFSLFLDYLDNVTNLRNILQRITLAINAWRNYIVRSDLVIYSLLLGIVFQLLSTIVNIIVARGLGIVLPFADWCWVIGVVSISIFLPITVAGIGLREGAFVVLLGYFGVPAESALALSLGVFSLFLCGVAVGAALEWIVLGKKGK